MRTVQATHPLLAPSKSELYQSGTAALAAAVLVAKSQLAANAPEVIVPAYACPDLISAVIYAQCKPVLVDIEIGLPYLQLDALQNALTANTAAIIAPWFLGIPERFDEIRACLAKANSKALLIEDSAQWFPEGDPSTDFCGDLVVLSFGKGKPVSLLGGGLLYDHRGDLRELFFAPNMHSPSTFSTSEPQPNPTENKTPTLPNDKSVPNDKIGKNLSPLAVLRVLAYNLLIHRLFFWVLELIPALNMGKTIYKPLAGLQAFPAEGYAILQANINKYLKRPRRAENGLKQLINDLSLSQNALCTQAPTYHQQRMLRFPVLVSPECNRDALLARLQQEGVGASPFYPAPLNEIDQIPNIVAAQGPFPNAKDFASRLITLPTHRGCNSDILLKIRTELSPYQQAQRAPLKVLHIASGDLWAGAEVQLFTLARALQQRADVQVNVVLLNEGELAARLRDCGIPVTVLPESRLGFAQLLTQALALARTQHPDVIHTHRTKENLIGSLIGLTLGIPSVRTVHGASEHVADWRKPHKRILQKLDQWLATFVQKKTIAVTNELAEKLTATLPPARITVIENGIDSANFTLVDTNKLDERFQRAKRRVGIIGRLVPVKRVDLFIKSAALLSAKPEFFDVEYFVIGDGPLRADLEQIAQAHPTLTNKLHFLGHQAAIHSYLRELDALVMCSDHEGLPMTLLEAMSLEVAVIGHDVGGIKLLLKEGTNGWLVEQQSADQFSHALAACLNDPDQRHRRTESAKQLVQQRYSATENARATISVYQSLT
ncbi:Glycosyl transferase, group 1 [gamma proteobacterium HdN1]|nr:Glycosyl transferase, group 1 [gamma proteobacterium HdN1]